MVRDLPLADHVTYRVGGPADLALFPRNGADLSLAMTATHRAGVSPSVLGGGSNVLVSDHGVRGVVILTEAMDRVEVDGHTLWAGAGVSSDQVAHRALAAGLSGAEFLRCLPGSVGGACFMNARAYDSEISHVFSKAEAVFIDGERRILPLRPNQFSYKRSPFQENGAVVARAALALEPGDPAAIERRMDRIATARHAKHELDFPSCGCVFKNDRRIGRPSGLIIEQCGLKGLRVGGAQVSPHHANFVFNLDDATAADIRAVIDCIQHTVHQKTGWTLEHEVQFLGDWD